MLSTFLFCLPDSRGPQQAAGVLRHSEHRLKQRSSMDSFTFLQPLIEHLLCPMYLQGSKTLKFFIQLKKYHRCLQGNKDGVAHPLLQRTHQAVASEDTGTAILRNCAGSICSLTAAPSNLFGSDCQEVSSGQKGRAGMFLYLGEN